jgi:hypothetical protein
MSVFQPNEIPCPWWRRSDVAERCLGLAFPKIITKSILGGSVDIARTVTDAIKHQVQQKVAHILLYSFREWVDETRRCTGKSADVSLKAYTAYVDVIVRHRLLKLHIDGFQLFGMCPQINSASYVCADGHYTEIASAKICTRSTVNDDDEEYNDEDEEDVVDDVVHPYFWCAGCVKLHVLVKKLI